MAKPFKGRIDLDIRDSTPDWDAFLPDKAPDGTPFIPQTPIVVTAENMQVVFDDGNAKISEVCTAEVKAACDKAGLK